MSFLRRRCGGLQLTGKRPPPGTAQPPAAARKGLGAVPGQISQTEQDSPAQCHLYKEPEIKSNSWKWSGKVVAGGGVGWG